MIAILFRALVLFSHARAAWPAVPADRVLAASLAAAAAETPAIAGELLLAIAAHESDLRPNAVSWRLPGAPRVDLVWDQRSPLPPRVVCGYLSAMATAGSCAAMVARDGGMRAGAAELEEWAATCGGDVACVVRGHAGGTACAVHDRCSDDARAFARLFLGNARRLGMPARRTST